LPLHFLGTFWRFIRQFWSDIELVLDIFQINEYIAEAEEPENSRIHSGEIEFKNISFTYDINKPE